MARNASVRVNSSSGARIQARACRPKSAPRLSPILPALSGCSTCSWSAYCRWGSDAQNLIFAKFVSEVDSLVSRTFARAQTPSRRAWLTAARRAVPGDRPTPSPRPVLTATPDFVSRHRSARRGRAPLRALFCPVRGLPPPVAVSSTARHALPDPSYHPVRAADSQHTLECMARPAEQRSRSAVCRVSRRRGASRAVAAQVAPSRRKLQ